MPYIDVDGLSIYHEVSGSGDPLVLLHGGYCSLEVMRELGSALADSGYQVHAPERPGHGRTSDVTGPYSYEAMLAQTLAYLDAVGLARAHVVGFSDGAITALLLARSAPERVLSLVPISANLDPSGFVSDEEAEHSATPEQHAEIAAENERLSPDGVDQVKLVLEKVMKLWATEPHIEPDSLAAISAPTLVMAGQRDMVSLEQTATIARSIPGAQLCIVPGTGHLLIREKPDWIAAVVTEFLRETASASTS